MEALLVLIKRLKGVVCFRGRWGSNRSVRSTWVTVGGGKIDDRADGEVCVGVRCVVAVGSCDWAALRVCLCGGLSGDV